MNYLETVYDASYPRVLACINQEQTKIHLSKLPPVPTNWKTMVAHLHAEQFRIATDTEYKALKDRRTFEEVVTEPQYHPIPLKWVYSYKGDSEGFLLKYKARICVRGDLQSMTNEDTYAATLAYKIFRTLMALVAIYDYETIQLDAVNAFLNADLEDVVHCFYPPGYRKPGHCLLLNKALYGLRKSPRLWLKLLGATLIKLGLYSVPDQPCIYTTYDGIIFFFYVDDIGIVFHSSKRVEANRIVQALIKEFEFRVLGEINWFLGIRVIRDRASRTVWLCQDAYIERIAKNFDCTHWKRVDTPGSNDRLQASTINATADEIRAYRSRIGSIQFATSVSRPDASRMASHLAEFLMNPSQDHQNAADRVIAYLFQTRFYSIQYGSDSSGLFQTKILDASADASFANNADRKSTQGFVFKLFGGPIHWASTKQATVTTSSTEAELLSVSQAAKELIWLFNFFRSIRFNPGCKISLQNDNAQTIRLLTNDEPSMSTKLKHVDIHQHWLRELVRSKKVTIAWVPTSDMIADGMTKCLSKQKHTRFIEQLRLSNRSETDQLD